MRVIQRGRTLMGIPKNAIERQTIESIVSDGEIIDRVKTPYGSINETKVFSAVPYDEVNNICYLYVSELPSLISNTNAKLEKVDLKGTDVDLTFNPELTPRDYQIPIIEELSKIQPIETLGLPLATGRGKTFTICKVLSNLNRRFFIYIKAEYIEKWVKDVELYFNIQPSELLIIQGKESLLNILSRTDFEGVKIFIIALQTFKVYIRNHLEGKFAYDVEPKDFLSHISTDIMLVDEGHEAFENIYRTYMMLAPNRAFILTATMYSIDKRIERYMEQLIPEDKRITDGFVNRHANAIGVMYNLVKYKGFKETTPFGYSHIMFEKSILKKTGLAKGMFIMYKTFIDLYYNKSYEKGDKCVVFFSTTRMCDKFITFIKEAYPDLNSSMYVQGYKFKAVLDNDIIATTIGKMGSAIDVPDLTLVLQTVVISSRTKNEQTIGRLRPIEGRELNYIFFNSVDIDSHKRNFGVRKSVLGRVSDKMTTMRYKRPVGL